MGFDPHDPVIKKDALPEVTNALTELMDQDTVLFDRGSRPEFGTFDDLVNETWRPKSASNESSWQASSSWAPGWEPTAWR